jgi:(2Fe-2S) ferredoxin
MCRGCCCGTTRKHPDVDHDGIAAVIEGAIGSDAELVRVDCLWACDLSNVVVVNPTAEARRQGARPAWVAQVNTLERARAVAQWVRQGGPGVADPPDELGAVLTAAGLRRVSSAGW